MKETAALLAGFLVLSLSGRLMYRGYYKLLGRLSRQDPEPVSMLLTGFSLATLFLLIIMAYTAVIIDLPLNVGSLLLSGVLMLVFDNVLLYIGYRFSQQLNHRELTRQLMLQKQQAETSYYKALEEQYDRQRVLIHDIRKHLAVMRDLADEDDLKAVAGYIRQLEDSPALQNRVRMCGNHALDVVLARYADICRGKGIGFSVDVRSRSVDFFTPGDITSLFGNLLENAVEAADGASEPYLELLTDLRPGGSLMVSLTNSCRHIPEADGKGGFLSSKPQAGTHGIGLMSVRAVVDKYNGTIRQYYEDENRLFHTVILISKS